MPPRGRALGAREVEGLAVRAREAEGLLAGAREAEGLAVRAREACGVTAAPRREGACRVDVARFPRVGDDERASGAARFRGVDRLLAVDPVVGTVPALAPERVMLLLGRVLVEARLRGVTAGWVALRLETLGARRALGEFVRPAVPFLVIAVARFDGLVIRVADRL